MRARFRRPRIEGARWRYGLLMNPRALYDAAVPEAALRDDKTGGLYQIPRQHVQVQVKGPRGGRKWQQL